MLLLSLIIALALELHFKIGEEIRQFSWFEKSQDFIQEIFSESSFYDGWGGLAMVLLLPCILSTIFLKLFDGGLYWIIYLLASTFVLFYCLGPKSLENSFRGYFSAMSNGDQEAAYLSLQAIHQEPDYQSSPTGEGDSDEPIEKAPQVNKSDEKQENVTEKDELVRSATRLMLIESEKRYFGVLTWFILAGPIAALLYRLTYLYTKRCQSADFDEHLPLVKVVLHWVEWVPTRITGMLFLLTGDFVNGFYRIKDYLFDANADNEQLIADTGVAALGLPMGQSEENTDENSQAEQMIHRTFIIYLLFAAFLTLAG